MSLAGSSKHILQEVTESILDHFGFFGGFGISQRALSSFLAACEASYHSNFYHNSVSFFFFFFVCFFFFFSFFFFCLLLFNYYFCY